MKLAPVLSLIQPVLYRENIQHRDNEEYLNNVMKEIELITRGEKECVVDSMVYKSHQQVMVDRVEEF